MKSKFIGSLLLAFIATLSIYSLSKIDINDKINTTLVKYFRRLSEEEMREQINSYCGKASGDLIDKYSNTAPDKFKYDVPGGNEIAKEFVKSNFTLVGADSFTSSFFKYSTKYKGYFTLLLLFIVLFILWIPCCCCVCCRCHCTCCCCCLPDICGKFTRMFVYASLFLMAIVLILSIVGLSRNTGIFEGVYGIGCSILKIEDHFARGDEYKQQKNYWIGVDELKKKLNTVDEAIGILRESAKNLTERLNSIDPSILEKNLTEDYENRTTMLIPSPLPDTDEGFQPEYLTKYGPITDNSTYLYEVNQEYSTIVNSSKKQINTTLSIITLADGVLETFNDVIPKVNDFLTTVLDGMEDGLTTFFKNFGNYLTEGDSWLRSAMNTLFSINLVLSIAVTVALVLIFFFDKGRCLLGLAWFFIFLFMLFSLLFGSLFGLVSNLFCDAGYGLNYFVKNIGGLNVGNLDDDVKGTINVCFNGDGSMDSSGLVPIDEIENPNMINTIVALQDNITEDQSIIVSYQLLSANKTINTLTNFKNNLTSISPNLSLAFDEIRNYIDSSVSESLVKTANIYDVWVDNQENCPSEYNYIPPNKNLLRNLVDQEKSCLVIFDWEENEIQDRYNGFKTDDEEDIIDTVLKYYKKIREHIDGNYRMIEEIISLMEQTNVEINKILTEEMQISKGTFDAIKPLIDAVKGTIEGNKSIFSSLLSCGFLRRDINFLIYQLCEGLGASLKSTSNTFIVIGMFELFVNLMTLIIMSTSAKKKEDKIKSSSIEDLGNILVDEK